jgi:hypothetical protein
VDPDINTPQSPRTQEFSSGRHEASIPQADSPSWLPRRTVEREMVPDQHMSPADGSGAAPTAPHRHVAPSEEVGVVTPGSSMYPGSATTWSDECSSLVAPIPVSSSTAPAQHET